MTVAPNASFNSDRRDHHYQQRHPHQHETWWDPNNPLMNDKNKAVIMEWIDQGLDFFGCDENVPKKVFGKNHTPYRIPLDPHKEPDLHEIDYAHLHDQLLESLMAEQSKKANDPLSAADIDSSASSFSFSNISSNSQLLSTSLSTVNDDSFGSSHPAHDDESNFTEMSASSKRGHKRPRQLKLHRRVMPALSKGGSEGGGKALKRKLSSNSSVSSRSTVGSTITKKNSSGSHSNEAVRVSLSDLEEAHFPPASSFIHPQCRLQKDKGKGEPAGSNICAKGREHCLLKLEQKMAVLTRVAFGEENKNKGTADMKRRPARVAEVFPNFTETRSIIELRMGFLSMQYGILLRWDTSRTGKVTLVVLRKMCHESFYSKCKHIPRRVASPRKMQPLPPDLPPCAVRNVIDGNHAILQRPDGMEVALLEPPYRVERPEEFQPSLLSVAVQYGTGLSQKSTWTVQLCYDGITENVLLTWDSQQDSFTPKLGDTLRHEIPISGSLDLSSLEIRLFEHRQRRGKSRRCVSHMHVPLVGLDAQPTNQEPNPKSIKVASSHDSDACITLSALLESDYAHWLRKELDARRREEVKAFVWKTPFRVVDVYETPVVMDEEEDDSLWEWICGAC